MSVKRVAVGLVVLALLVACSPDKPVSSTSVTSRTPDLEPSLEPSARYVPVSTDFELGVKVTEKQCFGSAGCNITFRVEPTYGGSTLSESDEWLVTYTVSGGDDGPQINSFTLRGTEISYDGSEFIGTKSAKVVLTAKVTAVTPN